MKVEFIAEVSSNHSRNLDRCKEFIQTASRIGCSGVKFQLFRIEELFAPEILSKSQEHRRRKEWELPVEFLPELSDYCKEFPIDFSCTPFYLEAVEELEPYVDFYKVASYELLWTDLLKKISQTGKPLVLSTGMANLDEIDQAVKTIRENGTSKLSLLHTVSGYPTPVSESNLKAIQTLRDRYNCPVGWSDHTVSKAVLHRAVHKWNAGMIEFHLDLDGKGEEYQTGHCWLPEEIESVINSINDGYLADGSGEKRPSPAELPDRDWRADPADGLRPLSSIRKDYNP